MRPSSALLALAAGLCTVARAVHAQSCGVDDDAGGMMCSGEDDGGQSLDEADGGPLGMQPDAAGSGGTGGSRAGSGGFGGQSGRGSMDAGLDRNRDECSCSATIDDPRQGRIHVCTEGQTLAACNDFSCTRGRVSTDKACDQSNIRLCCVMSARDLVSVLYDDCTHPNCEAGFTQQCNDFGGSLHNGDCASFVDGNSDDGDGGGGCAVASTHASSDLAGLALGLLGLLRARRRRS